MNLNLLWAQVLKLIMCPNDVLERYEGFLELDGFSWLSSHDDTLLVIRQNQCSGSASGSVGSVRFWAFWICILIR
jgi:hypothetical protein